MGYVAEERGIERVRVDAADEPHPGPWNGANVDRLGRATLTGRSESIEVHAVVDERCPLAGRRLGVMEV
jgi:hypothetical protein